MHSSQAATPQQNDKISQAIAAALIVAVSLLALVGLEAVARQNGRLTEAAREPAAAGQSTARFAPAELDSEAASYLATAFCDGGLCAGWETWIISEPGSEWQTAELQQVRQTLLTTIQALDDLGYDGRALLSGYRFRRANSAYVDGKAGDIAHVRHIAREIVLSDTAFQRLWGFYLYHELGHVVDWKLDKGLRRSFLAQTAGLDMADYVQTADGYWLNQYARAQLEEATADSFALMVIQGYTDNPRPVFAGMPQAADYEEIAAVSARALAELRP